MIAADYTGRRQQSGKREIMRDAHDFRLMLPRANFHLLLLSGVSLLGVANTLSTITLRI